VNISDVSVTYIERGGYKLIENTRSALALLRSGTPVDKWNMINKTGDLIIESKITQRLLYIGLSEMGTDVLRITGLGQYLSNLK
jgi:hypothetical protein